MPTGGINEDNSAFGFSVIEGKSSTLGSKGHIAIGTFHVERAKNYLETQGIEFVEETATYSKDGLMTSIYMRQEIGGFAVHLVRK